jgi:NAD(P)-dependent dehydrogenase (short-subunit alcohol dehydrogenase family)
MEAPMRDVEGKVAFITGGASGIGLGVAQAMVRNGMKVVITYRTPAHLQSAMKTLQGAEQRVHALLLEVSDRAAMEDAAKETVRLFGKVHVIVNNAGVAPTTPLCAATFDDFDWCMNVNVRGVFNGIRAFLPHISAHGEGGQIVATSSMVGGLIAGPFWGVYSTSKFAVVGMMEALRSELQGTNIGVSVFCPSAVSTNIGDSKRNRPAALSETGAPGAMQEVLMKQFAHALQEIRRRNPGDSISIDALVAGERMLEGIRNNNLYILSHPEYEQALRDRNDALLASIPCDATSVPAARREFAEVLRNPIYLRELEQRSRRRSSRPP